MRYLDDGNTPEFHPQLSHPLAIHRVHLQIKVIGGLILLILSHTPFSGFGFIDRSSSFSSSSLVKSGRLFTKMLYLYLSREEVSFSWSCESRHVPEVRQLTLIGLVPQEV